MEASTYPFMTSARVPMYVVVELPLNRLILTLGAKQLCGSFRF